MNNRFKINLCNLIFPLCPIPKRRSENQFAPFRVRGKQIDFYNNRGLKVINIDILKNNPQQINSIYQI